jgi:pimeloyl-ACP methyl ester carboxylesterase
MRLAPTSSGPPIRSGPHAASPRPLLAIALGVLLGVAILGAGAAGVLAIAYGRALTLSLGFAVPAAEPWLPAFRSAPHEVSFGVPGRDLIADVYRPAQAHGTLVIVHGLSRAGRRQPDLIRLARHLAGHGQVVLIPQLDSLAAFKLDGREIEALTTALDYASGLVKPVAVAGFSFGAGPALLAAAARPEVRLAGSFGGYADLRAVIAYITTGADAEPYNRWKLLQLLAGFVENDRDRATLDAIAAAKLDNPFADTTRLEMELGESGEAVLALVHNRRADALGTRMARLSPGTRAALDRLSPLPAMPRLRGRVLVAHGRADVSIPYTESVRLAEAAGTRAVILTTFHHTGPLSPLTLARDGTIDAWKLVRLADALLGAR